MGRRLEDLDGRLRALEEGARLRLPRTGREEPAELGDLLRAARRRSLRPPWLFAGRRRKAR